MYSMAIFQKHILTMSVQMSPLKKFCFSPIPGALKERHCDWLPKPESGSSVCGWKYLNSPSCELGPGQAFLSPQRTVFSPKILRFA